VELITRKGGFITALELRKSSRAYTSADDAETALDKLAAAGVAIWGDKHPAKKGGRPTRVFYLREAVPVTETPSQNSDLEVS
jgi:hypothetical protein